MSKVQSIPPCFTLALSQSKEGGPDFVMILCVIHVDPHERAKGGATVLHWACKSEKSDKELLQFVLNIHVK